MGCQCCRKKVFLQQYSRLGILDLRAAWSLLTSPGLDNLLHNQHRLGLCWHEHSHKVFGSMGSRYGVAVRGTLVVRDFYTSGRK
jgi:hypothetical protein